MSLGAEATVRSRSVPGDDASLTGQGARAPLGPPYPVILVHGFAGWGSLLGVDYFFGVVDDLASIGVDAIAPRTPAFASSSDRANVLADVITDVLASTGKAKVHLLCHSQGGVDARALLTEHPQLAPHIASVTMISTPNRGTVVADVAAAAPAGVLNPMGQLIGFLYGALESTPSDGDVDSNVDESLATAIAFLQPSLMEAWNAAHEDDGSVPIFSVAGVSNLRSLSNSACEGGVLFDSDAGGRDVVDSIFAASGLVLSGSADGSLFSPTPNDGLVTVDSAKWGTFLGCVPADHADEIGQVADLIPDLLSGFSHRALYRQLIEHARTVEME
jgi:triacylglycerol lipase